VAAIDFAQANKSYYSSKGKAIYSDFSTFAQGRALATANAIGFVLDFSDLSHGSSGTCPASLDNCATFRRCTPLVASATSRSGREGEIIVCEYGIGNGNFAKVFLDELSSRSPSLYARTRYHLFDISAKMIADARKNLAKHESNCEFHTFDAAQELPALPFHYCRINELLSDLPAGIYMRKNGGIFTLDGKPVRHPPLFAVKFLERIERERQIPFSFVAQNFLSALAAQGKPGFRIDLFDYGFYLAEDIFLLPLEEWNRLVVRKYGDQLTVDLNFLQLSSTLVAQGFSVNVELQKEYCERALGKKLMLTQTQKGLDYVSKNKDDGISEDDGFYHLRIDG